MTNSEKLSALIRHIKMVETNCNIISRHMMNEDSHFAITIAKRGRLHDLSKFDDLEFQNLWKGEKNFDIALVHHHTNNRHHPEHFTNGIYGMNDIDIAEMVADATARAQEFGTDIRIWFFSDDKAPKKYGYLGDKSIYDKIEFFLNMIINQPFEKS